MEFPDIKIYSNDFLDMLVYFAINLVFISIIIRLLYYRYTRRTEYVFTYYMVSIVLFFLCFTLKKFSLDIGMALGLFAIFGIIRYRTQQVEIKEMTYLFVVIGVSVINALVNTSMSLIEILGANSAIVGAIYFIEKLVLSKGKIEQRTIVYSELENIKPENYQQMLADLNQKTGLNVTEVKVQKVDFANQMATITIFYQVAQ
ncbi:MAG: DUF4956 domain-containing protein [Cytophagia bacterium]|nr:DUF4956 domain-containing protein [Cytophagia bacterium]